MRAASIGAGALSMVLIAGLGLFGSDDDGAGAAQASEDPATAGSGGTDTVTLITGDRVLLTETAEGRPRVDVRPGPGRDGIAFTTRSVDGHLSVLPADALELLGAGRLDPRLFDVSLLSAAGYDDAATDVLPLIVDGSDAARQRIGGSGTAGVSSTEALPALEASAVRTAKRDLGAFWEDLVGSDRTMAAGVAKVWLDGPVRATLDESVEQVGAPAAWDSGYTGEGVRIAVLDTGIDADHPDLADAVVARKDFSGSGGAGDVMGHGTHVASIIAGDGAASDGRYSGVAPDGELLNGKVLDDSGSGLESGIIRGMEWAVRNDADVVNMSLGGCATGATDPLTEAVDRLSESSGTLFVIAAGNHDESEQPCRLDEAVSSPATADSALAVGSVDKSDELSDFSNIGPRTHDGAVKPELTAPGEQIRAARAADSAGTGRYTTYSGTSMAAPHVAGAAAVLAQRHPGWDGDRLRDRLLATAEPNPDLSVFEQGAGRLALDAAVRDSTITASPSVLSAPRANWPHHDDEPWSSTLTYRNAADEPVTLRLSTTGTGPDGEAAADGLFALDRETLRVPANGSASATLTVDSSVAGPDGLFSGEVLAETADGERVARTPVGLDKEPESYDLTLRLKNGAGKRVAGQVMLADPANQDVADLPVPKQGRSIRLPAGRYDLVTSIWDETGERQTATLVTKPDQELDADRTVVLDAGAGKPVDVSVPSETAERVGMERVWSRTDQMSHGILGGAGSDDGNMPPTELRITPTGQVDEDRHEFGWMGTLAEPPSAKRARAYGLHLARPGGVPENPRFDVKHRELARIHDLHHGQGVADPQPGTMIATAHTPDGGLLYDLEYDVRTAGSQVQYLSASPGLRWDRTLETARSTEYANARNPARYQPGKHYTERWNAAPLGLRLEPHVAYDQLWSSLTTFAPSGHTAVVSNDGITSSLVVRKNGKVVLSSSDPNGEPVALDVDRARYDWRLRATRDVEWSDLGTETNARWTVEAGPDEQGHLPVPQLWMTGKVDRLGRAPGSEPFQLGLTVRAYDNTVPEVRNLRLEVSFDDGERWREVPVRQRGDGFTANVPEPPANATAVSTRVSLRTAESELEQTMVRAYGIDRTE